MSHFTVMVVGDDPAARLQPFHEFECTGEDDQYVQDIDITDEKREEFNGATRSVVRLADGTVISRHDDQCYREPTPAELKEIGPIAGSGCAKGFIFTSKDWGDGRGYRAKLWSLPEGAEEAEMPFASFAGFLAYEFHDNFTVPHGTQPDLSERHKYGYALLDEAGDVVKVIDRTNPNKKWDWWVVGGRWKGKLLSQHGRRVDSARVGDINFDGMIADHAVKAARTWDGINGIVAGRPVTTWEQLIARVSAKELSIDEARDAYHSQPVLKELYDSDALDRFDGADTLSKVLTTPREQFIEREAKLNASTWALLHDGQWTERGRMGWWASSDATDESTAEQVDRFWSVLRSLPADTLLTVVDCHI